jgi:hypothetical protein
MHNPHLSLEKPVTEAPSADATRTKVPRRPRGGSAPKNDQQKLGENWVTSWTTIRNGGSWYDDFEKSPKLKMS